jgi:hypothetical protein
MNESFETMKTVLKSLGERLGLALVADDDGACGMRVDGRLLVTLECEAHTGTLLVSAEAGELPADDASAAMRSLLAQNYLWQRSAGATWSLRGDTLVLMQRHRLEALDVDVLVADLTRFIAVARRAQDLDLAAPDAEHAEAALPPGMVAA